MPHTGFSLDGPNVFADLRGIDLSSGFSIMNDFLIPNTFSEVSTSVDDVFGAYMLLQPNSQSGAGPDPTDLAFEPDEYDNMLDVIGHVADSFDFF